MSNIPTDILNRERYINVMLPFVDKPIIKVITGQRRVGKSYLLYQMMNWIEKNIEDAHLIYINKEDLAFDFIKSAQDLSYFVDTKLNQNGKTYLFIDEIQEIENFHAALRSLLLNTNIDLYCTGSNANLLSSEISGKLSGRYIEQTVYSLSYTEFLHFHNLEDNMESLEKYMKYGGLPYLKHLPLTDEVVFEYLKSVYSTIIYRDIVNRFNIRNTNFLEHLVLFLASNTGSLFSSKKISDFLKSQHVKMNPNQVQTYVSHLLNAYIILDAKRYNIHGKRLFEIGEKYYFENLGIRNAIWGYRIEDRGKIVENLVFNHLRYLQYDVQVGALGDKEIDFIAVKNNELAYFQVALQLKQEKTIEREFGNLLEIQDNYPKYVITLDNFSGNTSQGIKVMTLSNFLNASSFT